VHIQAARGGAALALWAGGDVGDAHVGVRAGVVEEGLGCAGGFYFGWWMGWWNWLGWVGLVGLDWGCCLLVAW
jgi:hypothetical protein